MQLGGRKVGDHGQSGLEVEIGQRRMLRKHAELAVPPHDRRLADFQMNVARAELHGAAQDRIQLHVEQIGSYAAVLEPMVSTRRRGARTMPRASPGCARSPRRKAAITPQTSGMRAIP